MTDAAWDPVRDGASAHEELDWRSRMRRRRIHRPGHAALVFGAMAPTAAVQEFEDRLDSSGST